MIEQGAVIYVAGHQGLVGSAIVRLLQNQGYRNIVTRTLQELDLRDQQAVRLFFNAEKPAYVFLAAARVGGIQTNALRPAEFIYDNLAIQLNVLHAAYEHQVKKLLFLGSSCIYPRDAEQPIKEESLLTGPLEKTNEPYAVAKIAGITFCQSYNKQYGTNFISVMPTNLYGPGDNFDQKQGHVIPALIAKFCDAVKHKKSAVVVGGSGTAYREFLYVDDCAQALLFLMNHYNDSATINIGSGTDITIKELVDRIARITGFEGTIVWDTKFPDGTPRKQLDVRKLRALGWHAQTSLNEGLLKTVAWYKKHENK